MKQFKSDWTNRCRHCGFSPCGCGDEAYGPPTSEDILKLVGLADSVKKWNQGIDPDDEDLETFQEFVEAIVQYVVYEVLHGNLQFTPKHIVEEYRSHPMDIIEDWLREGVEEWLVG